MSISGVGGASAYSYFPQNSSSQAPAADAAASSASGLGAAASASSPEQEFLDYMKETPAQQMEDAWLKAHHLTRAQLAAMSPQQREAIEKQMQADITAKVKQDALDKANTSTTKTDILV
jgi:hypothetical protein